MRVKLLTMVVGAAAMLACTDGGPVEPPPAAMSPSFDISAADLGDLGAMATGAHNSAGVAKNFLCGVGFSLTTDSHETISNSGNQLLFCKGTHPLVLQKTLTLTGLGCGFFFGGSTTDSRLVLTPKGSAILTCKNNPSS